MNCKNLKEYREFKKNKVREQILPDLKAYYKTIVIKHFYGIKIDKQITRAEHSSGTDPYIHRQIIFYKSAKTLQHRKDNLPNKLCENKQVSIKYDKNKVTT